MKIKIEFHKMLAIKNVESGSIIEVRDGCTIRDLYSHLGIAQNQEALAVPFVNNEAVWKSTVIRENDTVTLHLAVSGG